MARISDNMEQPSNQPEHSYSREQIYVDPDSLSPFQRFKIRSYNTTFRTSIMTWITLAVLLLGYPAISMVGTGDDPAQVLKNLDDVMRMVTLIATIIMLWTLFTLVVFAVWRERTTLAGIGFRGLKNVDAGVGTHAMLSLVWGIAFLAFAMVFLSGLAWLLAKIGLPVLGELSFLVPQDAIGRLVWVGVSITAGVCEETLFRGYLMTRLRLVFGLQGWTIPVIISSLAFGICHSYQGLPGIILLSAYGALFALLYIRTGSLWPCIVAHFFQDLIHLFIPQ